MIRLMIESALPLEYPAIVPSRTPMTTTRKVDAAATNSETRAPYSSRASTL